MRDCAKSAAGWLIPLAVLLLPNCSLSHAVRTNIVRGDTPRSSVVFCDVENMAVARRCATAADLASGMAIRLSDAAIALADRESSNVVLDDTATGIAACSGVPQVITYRCPFPDGCPYCLNCSVIGSSGTYADANALCTVACDDLNSTPAGTNPPSATVAAFCGFTQHASVSTNTSVSSCTSGACNDGGTFPVAGFADPRRIAEPVVWTNPIGLDLGADVSGPVLTRTEPNPTSGFDAGASSGATQLITRGGGFVQFTVPQSDRTLAIGLSSGAPPDGDAGLGDMTFALVLTSIGQLEVVENGSFLPPNPATPSALSWGSYAAGDEFRVTLSLQADGSARASYEHNGFVLPTAGRSTLHAAYPFRVDVSLQDQGASVSDVGLVRLRP